MPSRAAWIRRVIAANFSGPIEKVIGTVARGDDNCG